MASLLMIRGRDAGKHFAIGQENLVMGRDSGCDITLADSEVSRQHAMILREGCNTNLST